MNIGPVISGAPNPVVDRSQVPAVRKELLRFLIVGCIAVAIDATTYTLLIYFEILSPSWSKRVSFGLGAVWAFIMNKYYTFEQEEFRTSEPFLFIGVYIAGWFFNSITHDVVLARFNAKPVAFLIATGVSTCSNFVGQKWIVFRAKEATIK